MGLGSARPASQDDITFINIMKSTSRTIHLIAQLLPLILLSLGATPTPPKNSADPLTLYQERYARLVAKDVPGRLTLAKWCQENRLFHQEAELLREVLGIQPQHAGAYRGLLTADGRRVMPVEKTWALKLEALLGQRFKLFHTPHFTILTDFADDTPDALGQVMEETYRNIFADALALGVRPLPPNTRLVCILFERYQDFTNHIERESGPVSTWAHGYYLIRSNRSVFFHSKDSPIFEEKRRQIAEMEDRMDELDGALNRTTGRANRSRINVEMRQLEASHAKLADQLGSSADFATDAVTRHEVAHQLLYNIGFQRRDRSYPFWLSEGLATVFELCDKKGNAGPGFVNLSRLYYYRQCKKAGGLMNLAELLRERPAEDADTDRVNESYAQAWALFHFLWNRRPNELRNFLVNLDREGTPRDWVAFFRAHFGENLANVERDFRRHVDSLHD